MAFIREKTRVPDLARLKRDGRPIVMTTAYDCPMGRLVDEAGADVVLVGDSVGNVVLGYEDSTRVTMDDMVHHCAAVARGVRRALLVGDMPFLSFKVSPEEALCNAGRLVQEGGVEAVKMEGGREVAETARRIVEAGIPVMGHVGYAMQSIHALGGGGVQGRTQEAAERILADALALQEAGCFAVVLEAIPWDLGGRITRGLDVPTIGIGAGGDCDGQVLVLHDLLGIGENLPRFVKKYAELGATIREAVGAFAREVRDRHYPDRAHAYGVSSKPDERKKDA